MSFAAVDVKWADELDYRNRRTAQPSPEQALAAAVFGEAITDLTRGPGGTSAGRALAQTREWLESKSVEPMSFLFWCVVLELDPSAARCALRAIVPCSSARALVGLRTNVGTRTKMGTRKKKRRPYVRRT